MGRMSPAVQYLTMAALLLHSFFCTKGECLSGLCADMERCCPAVSPAAAPGHSHFDCSERSVFSAESVLFQAEEHHHTECRHGTCRCLESDLSQEDGLLLLLLVFGLYSLLLVYFPLNEPLPGLLPPGRWAFIQNRRTHLILNRFLI